MTTPDPGHRLPAALRIALLMLAPFALVAQAAPELAVEVKVIAAELDSAGKPHIAEVELSVVNRADRAIRQCDFVLDYLDAAGKLLKSYPHAISAIELKPGEETLASFQDVDPPQAWAGTITVTAKCR